MFANVFSVLALACSLAVLVLHRQSSPSTRAERHLETAVSAAQSHLKAAERLEERWATEVALFTAARASWAVEFSGIAERCDETLDRAESKRRRVAAATSRDNGHPPQEMTREQIIAAARARTLGGV